MIKNYLHRLLELITLAKEKNMQIVVTRGNQQISLDPEEFEDFSFQSGDDLSITPLAKALQLFKTPDSHLHFTTSRGTSFRVPSTMTLKPFREYLIPEHLCILTGAGTDTLDPYGKKHCENYAKYMGLRPEMTFLEIGCGIGRDAFQLLSYLTPKGTYIGIDVTYDSIAWLKKNISQKYPNFSFFHFDARHELYNPLGAKTSLDFTLPAEDSSVDRMALGSVFTHLFEEEIVHYLKEIRRVLKPDGLAYATFFLYSKEAVNASRKNNLTPFNLRFDHAFGDGCYVNDPVYKTGAVAYTREALDRMVSKAGLQITQPLIKGAWSGLYSDADDGQEVAILGVL